MKKIIIILGIFSVIILSCEKGESLRVDEFENKDTITNVISDLKFKLNPTDSEQFTFSISTQQSGSTCNLCLIKNNEELANSFFNESGSVILKYDFSPNESYDLIFYSTIENNDTVFQEKFIIKNYKHKFYNKFNLEKLASIHNLVDIDISPSRNVIFYTDLHGLDCYLKRLTIPDEKLDVLDEDFFSYLVRTKNDNELIVEKYFYENRRLGADSLAFYSYDINTSDTSFICWGASNTHGWHGYSRVVNNSILLPNPEISNTVSLIDFSDNSTKTFHGDVRYIGEGYYQIGWQGKVLDFNTKSFVNQPVFLSDNQIVHYFDENSQYYIVTENKWDLEETLYTRMIIYKNNEVVSELPFEKNRSFIIPSEINLTDNQLIFKQIYSWDSTIRYDGYYLLDIGTSELSLLQNDNNSSILNEFFSDDKSSFISVQPDGIYQFTLN